MPGIWGNAGLFYVSYEEKFWGCISIPSTMQAGHGEHAANIQCVNDKLTFHRRDGKLETWDERQIRLAKNKRVSLIF